MGPTAYKQLIKRKTILLIPSENLWGIGILSRAHACLPTRNQCNLAKEIKGKMFPWPDRKYTYIPSRVLLPQKSSCVSWLLGSSPAVVPSESGHHSGTHKLATGQTRAARQHYRRFASTLGHKATQGTSHQAKSAGEAHAGRATGQVL